MIELPKGCASAYPLRNGSYKLRVTLDKLPESSFQGTLRIDKSLDEKYFISGDLYKKRTKGIKKRSKKKAPLLHPNPKKRIPIYPIANYTFYLSVSDIRDATEDSPDVKFDFALYEFDHIHCFSPQQDNTAPSTWRLVGNYTALFTPNTKRGKLFSDNSYANGIILSRSGASAGKIGIMRTSDYLRRAIIEIDKEDYTFFPYHNGSGRDWHDVFNQFGWDVTLLASESKVQKKHDNAWSLGELHQFVMNNRDIANLDRAWCYHLLCVRSLENSSRGIMYDFRIGDDNSNDPNNIPREGAAIVSPIVDEKRPPALKKFSEDTAFYFRTALHEVGHAMGLGHNKSGLSFMRPTNHVTREADSPKKINWNFSVEDQFHLKHLPDIRVRPGGIPYDVLKSNGNSNMPMDSSSHKHEAASSDHGLRIKLEPQLKEYPAGAPIRVNLEIINQSTTANEAEVPSYLQLHSGLMKGMVQAAAEKDDSAPMVIQQVLYFADEDSWEKLPASASKIHSFTLLNSGDRLLFSNPGEYKLAIELSWSSNDGRVYRVPANTSITIAPVSSQAEKHTLLIKEISDTPELFLLLALGGGDHLRKGIRLLNRLLKFPLLAPHYSLLKARQIGNDFFARKGNFKRMYKSVMQESLMGISEIRDILNLIKPSVVAQKDFPKASLLLNHLVKKVDAMRTWATYTQDLDALSTKIREKEQQFTDHSINKIP